MLFRIDSQANRRALLSSFLAASLLCASLHAGPVTDFQWKMKSEDHRIIDFVTAVKSTYPTAYYRLNAMAGPSWGGQSQYKTVGSATVSQPGAPIGFANNSFVRLDGRSEYIATTQTGGIKTRASLMAFVNLDSMPSDAKHFFYVMGESQNGNDLELQFGDDNTLQFNTANGSPLSYTPPSNSLAHKWHLIIATVSSTSKKRVIYWDGEAVASDNAGDIGPKTGTLSIGASPAVDARFFHGGIEEAALWDRALTADEVAAIYRTVDTK